MSDTDPGPRHDTAPLGTSTGTVRYSVPEVARLLGISERAVRKRITAGALDAHKEGNAWVVLLQATMRAVPTAPAAPEAVPSTAPVGGTGPAAIDLTPLVEHLEHKDAEIQRLNDALAGWQFRALRAEERVQALEAGPIVQAGEQPRGHTAVDAITAPTASDTPAEGTDPQPRQERPWWRRLLGLPD